MVVQRQREFFLTGQTGGTGFRHHGLKALMDALDRHESGLIAALRADLGKPAVEAFVSEIAFLRGEIRHALRNLGQWTRPRRAAVPMMLWPASARIVPEPRGCVLVVGPWNYPVQLLLAPAVAAIAAGNCVVLKPSELAPATAEVLRAMIAGAFPPEHVVVETGGREKVAELIDARPDLVFFTGGTVGGRAVMEAAARHLIPTVLELGGKSPCIVCRDAPLETTARRIVWGKFLNAGQTCVAPDHVWVDESIRNPLVAAMKRALEEFFSEDARRSADYGRIGHERHFDRLIAMLGDAEVLHGGRSNRDDRFIEPTLTGPPHAGSPMAEEEIFGPLLPVIPFRDVREVIDFHRERPVPLAMYVFTRDPIVRDELISGIRSGGVCVNDTISHILPPGLPFGGLGASGMGAYHGKTGFDTMSHLRSVMRRPFIPDPSLRYPPVRTSLSVLKRFLRWFG